MKYNRLLDGLRGVAILLVILFHFHYALGMGWIGVQLFFVLSGYLITTNLLVEKDQPLGFYLKRFYWRRTLRIFPLYYLYLAFVAGIFILSGIPEDFSKMIPWLLTYTFDYYPLAYPFYYLKDTFFMHLWSLSVEEQFYLLWPLVLFIFSRKQLQYILIGIVLFAPIVRFVLGEYLLAQGFDLHYIGETVYRFAPGQWDGFAFGAMIPIFSLQERSKDAGKYLLVAISAAVLCGVWNMYGMFESGIAPDLTAAGYQIGDMIHFQHVWSYTVLDFLFFMIIIYIFKAERTNNRFLNGLLGNDFIVYVGKISYGLYIYHFLIWMTFNKYSDRWFSSRIVGFLTYLTVCMIVASVSFFVFERRILSLKNRAFQTV